MLAFLDATVRQDAAALAWLASWVGLALDPAFGPDATDIFNLEKAMSRRALTGAPGTKEVRRQLARWRKALPSPPPTTC